MASHALEEPIARKPALVGTRFLYFDLGNVLLKFDHRLASRQMGEVAGVPADVVWEVVFAGDLEQRYESGEIGDREFYEIFCQQTSSRPTTTPCCWPAARSSSPTFRSFRWSRR